MWWQEELFKELVSNGCTHWKTSQCVSVCVAAVLSVVQISLTSLTLSLMYNFLTVCYSDITMYNFHLYVPTMYSINGVKVLPATSTDFETLPTGLGLLPVPAAQVELLGSSARVLEHPTPRLALPEKLELWNLSVGYRSFYTQKVVA